VLLAAGCASSTPPSAADCDSESCAGECVAGICVDDVGVADADAGTDPDNTDISVDQINGDATTDGGDPPDAGEDDGPTLGGLGDPCLEDSDCESRQCVDTIEGSICTELCRDECPEGYACVLLTETGVDAVRVCLPVPEVLCEACDSDVECGGFGAYCLEQSNGSFCATDCTESRDCREGYACNPFTFAGEGPGGADLEVSLCEPVVGACNPVELSGSRFTAGGAVITNSRFNLLGRALASPHTLQNERFTLVGGF